jgi:hypothetical protein
MERINEDAVELIDLGAASVETDGVGLQQKLGLSDD